MDANELMNNEDVMEVAEEIVVAGSGKSFKMAVGIGLGMLAGVYIAKYAVNPIMEKIKDRKRTKQMMDDVADLYDADVIHAETVDVTDNQEDEV